MNYTPNVRKSTQTFVNVLQKAKEWFASLSKTEQQNLIDELEHGASHLTNIRQLNACIAKYGEIHQAKLLNAYEKIPSKVWYEGGITVIDYGCGQGIAEMVLSDYLTSRYVDNDYIKDFILIEPSRTNLQRCVDYVKAFFRESKISAYCKRDDQINDYDINPKSATVIHIFSNVIDLDDFDGNGVLSLLNEDKSHNNIIVCVSPYYQEATRGKRIKEFGDKLQGYSLVYKLEKHTDDWDKPYSCQIYIFVSSYY